MIKKTVRYESKGMSSYQVEIKMSLARYSVTPLYLNLEVNMCLTTFFLPIITREKIIHLAKGNAQCQFIIVITMKSVLLRLCCSISKLCPTLYEPMGYSTPGPSILYCLLEFAQIHAH